MAQPNGPTNNQQQACEITIQGLWAQTGKYLDFYMGGGGLDETAFLTVIRTT